MAVQELKIEKPKRRKKSVLKIVLSVAFCIFTVYFVCQTINQQVQIGQRKDELDDINGEITIQEVKNEEIAKVNDSGDSESAKYIERLARENLDYAYKDERIFIVIAGD